MTAEDPLIQLRLISVGIEGLKTELSEARRDWNELLERIVEFFDALVRVEKDEGLSYEIRSAVQNLIDFIVEQITRQQSISTEIEEFKGLPQ